MRRLVGPLLIFVLSAAIVSSAQAGVRYAGHVEFTHTSCCGLNSVVFKVFGRSHVHYRVCVRKPNGSKRCHSRITRLSGQPSRVSYASEAIGTYRVSWKVHGHVVDRAEWVNVVEGVRVKAPPGLAKSKHCGGFSFPGLLTNVHVRVTRGPVGCERAKRVMKKLFNRGPGSSPENWNCIGPQTGYALCSKADPVRVFVATF